MPLEIIIFVFCEDGLLLRHAVEGVDRGAVSLREAKFVHVEFKVLDCRRRIDGVRAAGRGIGLRVLASRGRMR